MNRAPLRNNPFPGLRPFTQDEDYLFFGREEQTIELLQRLAGNRFVAVVGTSGSGKSSLVRCGLLSELLGGKMLGAGAAWEIAVTHPGGNPLAILTDALLEADLYDRAKEHARENLLATLSRSHYGLVEAVKQADLGDGTNFLLVVDQFEEIFRFHEAGQTQQEAANEFVSLLLEAAAQREVPIYVVLTMRSDFIGECGQFEGLAEMVNRGEFLIPRLNREQYKRVIEGPIKVAGGQIAPRLLQRLLNDLGQQADQLPCLQHALMRTWDVWASSGVRGQGSGVRGQGTPLLTPDSRLLTPEEALDLDDYQRVGKMSQALSLHADEIYDSLDDRQRELCRGIFQALTVEESNSRGIRRPQRLGRLRQILEVSAEELLPVIDAYRRSGVTFLMPSPEVELTDSTIVDISHESLMRVWTRLRQWVEEETQAAGIYRRLSESADLHERGKAGLYRDPELGIALAWRDAKRPNAAWAERYRPGFATAMNYLEESRSASVAEERAGEAARQRELEQAERLVEAQQVRLDQQHRAARKLRKLIGGLALVALVAGLALVAALVSNERANELAVVAKQKSEIAVASAEDADRERKAALLAQKATETALTQVESSLTKAEKAEQVARAAEEEGRKLQYTTDMRLAPFVWRDDRTTAEQLRLLLAKHVPDRGEIDVKPDLRGFEWDYYKNTLDNGADVFAGHAASVVGGAFASNGQLVTLDQDGAVRRWSLETREEDRTGRRELMKGGGEPIRVQSPDGSRVAMAEGNTVYLFDSSTGQLRTEIPSTLVPGRRLLFTPDSGTLIVVDDKIRWCNAVDGKTAIAVNQKFNRGSSLAVSADGLTLAVVGHGSLGNLFSAYRLDKAANKVTTLAQDTGPAGTLSASALSSDGRLIAVAKKLSGPITVYDAVTGRLVAEHRSAHASPISAMAFSANDFKLVTADNEGTIKIWEDARKLTSRSAALLTFKGHAAAVNHLGLSPSGTRLVSAGADATARVWDLDRAGAAVRVLERAGANCAVARYSPDGQWIALADGGALRLWDATTGRLVREFSTADKGRIYSLAFSPADPRLLAVGYGGHIDVSHVELWDIDAGRELARLPGATIVSKSSVNDEHDGAVGALAFSPDGKHLVAGFGSPALFTPQVSPSPLKVWEVATRRLIRRLNGHTGYCVSLDFSKDGSRLASGSRDGTAIVWSTANWKAEHELQNPDRDPGFGQSGNGMVDDVVFSPDGKTLAMASRIGSVVVWDAVTGKRLETLKGHSGAVGAVAFSPDGRTLATGGGDQTVRLWNVETRRELFQLDAGTVELGGVETLAFSPDGKHLLAGGRTGSAFWSAEPMIWNEPARAVEILKRLRQSNADFRARIRLESENLRLHEALEKLDAKDAPVQAALAAARANWHASHARWAEAVREYDRFQKLGSGELPAWLRTPGLLRVATALVHGGRPDRAASLLTGGAKLRVQDGLPPIVEIVGLGFQPEKLGDVIRVAGLVPDSPASRSKLQVGDILLRVNDVAVTDKTDPALADIIAGGAGTKIRLTVLQPSNGRTEEIELAVGKYLPDPATGELGRPLRAAIEERLAKAPRDAGLLELRAELAGQWSDTKGQVADYTAAIEALSMREPKPEDELKRLHGRRGTAYVELKQWPEAVADFTRADTDKTTDEELLANQARALAGVLLQSRKDSAATSSTDPWVRLAAAYRLAGDQKAIDHLVARRPQAAGSIGDLFAADSAWPRALEIYSRGITPKTSDGSLLGKRAFAFEQLKDWNAAEADWARAATGNPLEAQMLFAFADRLAVAGQLESAKGHYEKTQALYERMLAADPDSDLVAAELARLLVNKHQMALTIPERDRRIVAFWKVADPWLQLGAAYGLNGRNDEAFRYLDRTLRPTDASDSKKSNSGFALPDGLAELLTGVLLDDAMKAKLRGRLFDLLKASLADGRKRLASDKPDGRFAVAEKVHAWQKEDNLASLRDPASLAKLPADERDAFTRFWAEATELLFAAIAGLPADKQGDLVATWLFDLNPGFEGTVARSVERGVLTGLVVPSPRAQDLTPLRALPALRTFIGRGTLGYDNRAESDAALLRSLKSLETINGKPVAEFWKAADAKRAEFNAWLQRVPTLPAEQQVKEVAAKLKERNPSTPCYVTVQSKTATVTDIWVHEAYNLTDLSPVLAFPDLKTFKTDAGAGGHLTDLSPLAGLKKLTKIHIGNMPVRDLAPIKGMPLAELALDRCPRVQDLSPLEGLPLDSLILTNSAQIRDLSPLKGMKLKYLQAQGISVTDLTPLAGMPLKSLDLAYCRGITDLIPLRGMPLEYLNISELPIADLSSIAGIKSLTYLSMQGTPVANLTPLLGLKLKRLEINGSPVSNLSPLKGMQLEYFRLTPKNIVQGLEVVRGMKSLKTVATVGTLSWPAAEFWTRYDQGEFK